MCGVDKDMNVLLTDEDHFLSFVNVQWVLGDGVLSAAWGAISYDPKKTDDPERRAIMMLHLSLEM